MAAPPKFVQCFDGLGFSRQAIEYLWANRPKDAPLDPKTIRAVAKEKLWPNRDQLEEEARQWHELFGEKKKPEVVQ